MFATRYKGTNRHVAVSILVSVCTAVLLGGAFSLNQVWAQFLGDRGVRTARDPASSASQKQPGSPVQRKLDPVGPSIHDREGRDHRRYTVLAEYPHDHDAFTQGLAFWEGQLYESTGLTGGKSSLRKVTAETGEVTQIVNLAHKYFGEGMVIHDGKVVQLTWQHRTGFQYDARTFEPLQQFVYKTVTGQGWGITSDGKELIVSDGSSWLFFWDPVTLAELRRVQVHLPSGKPLARINELEWVEGRGILANVWFDDSIYTLDPDTGSVTDIIDFSALYPHSRQRQEITTLQGKREACLNGIAWDPKEDVLYLTGKLWPHLFKVKLHD